MSHVVELIKVTTFMLVILLMAEFWAGFNEGLLGVKRSPEWWLLMVTISWLFLERKSKPTNP